MTAIDLATTAVRDANRQLQSAADGRFEMLNPRGAHALACGLSTHASEQKDHPSRGSVPRSMGPWLAHAT